MEENEAGNLLETVLTAYNQRCKVEVTTCDYSRDQKSNRFSHERPVFTQHEQADELPELRHSGKRAAPTKPKRKGSSSRTSTALLGDLDLGEPLNIQSIMDSVKAKNENSQSTNQVDLADDRSLPRFSVAVSKEAPSTATSRFQSISSEMEERNRFQSSENWFEGDGCFKNNDRLNPVGDHAVADNEGVQDVQLRSKLGNFSRKPHNCSLENLAESSAYEIEGSDTSETGNRLVASTSVQSDLNYVGIESSPRKKLGRFGSRRRRDKKQSDKEFGQSLDPNTTNSNSAYAKFRQFKKAKLKNIRAKKDELLDSIPRKVSISKTNGGFATADGEGNGLIRSGQEKILRCGWLRKQGGMMKSWNDRWFLLTDSGFYYYKDKDESKLLGTIPLYGNQLEENTFQPNEGAKFLFEIIVSVTGTKNQNIYTLAASSKTEKEEWIRAIKKVMSGPQGGGVFGQDLLLTIQQEQEFDEKLTGERSLRKVPVVVEKCCEFIRESNGYFEEGLFRLPGQANDVQDLRDAFDAEETPSFDKRTDVHTVASLLKSYLRELPEPVVPFDLYEDLIDAAKAANPVKQTIKRISTSSLSELEDRSIVEARDVMKSKIDLLPQENFDLLRYLCRFLDEVQRYSEKSKMDIANLALVFGPNILRSKNVDPVTMMSHSTYVQYVMSEFIKKHKYFFGDEDYTVSIPDVAADANRQHFSTKIHTSSELHSAMEKEYAFKNTNRSPEKGLHELITDSVLTPSKKQPQLDSAKSAESYSEADIQNARVGSGSRPHIPPKPTKPRISQKDTNQSPGPNAYAVMRRDQDQRGNDNTEISRHSAELRAAISGRSSSQSLSHLNQRPSSAKISTRNSFGDSLQSDDGDSSSHSPKYSDKQRNSTNYEDAVTQRQPHPPARKRKTRKSETDQYGTVPRPKNYYVTDEESNTESIVLDDKHEMTSVQSSRGGSVSSVGDSTFPRRRESGAGPPKRPTSRPPPPPKVASVHETQASKTDRRSSRQLTYEELLNENQILQEKLKLQRADFMSRTCLMEEQLLQQIQELRRSSSLNCADATDDDVIAARDSVSFKVRNSREFTSDNEFIDHLRESVAEERKLRRIAEIQLKNEKRGRQSAEERNVQLQKEMKEFFYSCGSDAFLAR